MAWEDRTPFDAIEKSFGLSESQVIQLMRLELKRGSFELWRKRVTGRATKHQQSGHCDGCTQRQLAAFGASTTGPFALDGCGRAHAVLRRHH